MDLTKLLKTLKTVFTYICKIGKIFRDGNKEQK